jgi:negative regulator of flagellin synthesis FlgM
VNINDALNKQAGLTSVTPQQKPAGDGGAVKNASAGATPAASDSVRMSPQYQTLEKSVANSSSFNAEKVAAIKKDIAEGRYSVNSEKIADGVLSTAQDLVNSRKAS